MFGQDVTNTSTPNSSLEEEEEEEEAASWCNEDEHLNPGPWHTAAPPHANANAA